MKIKQLSQLSTGISGYVLLLGALVINILLQGAGFFHVSNFNSVLSSNLPLIIAAVAQMIVMLSGGIDISIGTTMALVNTIAIVLPSTMGLPVAWGWIVALAAGAAVGLVNGAAIAFLRIPPLLATFASATLIQGLSLVVLPKPGGSVPAAIYQTYGGSIWGVPTAIWVVLVVIVFLVWITRYPFGKYVSAIGSNEKNAYASGIPVSKIKLLTYTLSGLIAGVAGLCLTALTASGDPRIGGSFALTSIAAVVIGGTLGAGKWRSYLAGAVVGALFLAIVNSIVFYAFSGLSNLFPKINISTFYQQLLTNFIIIFGLASAVLTNKKNFEAKPGGEAN